MSVEKFPQSEESKEENVATPKKKSVMGRLRKAAALGALTGAVAGFGGEALAGERKQLSDEEIESVRKQSDEAFDGMRGDTREFNRVDFKKVAPPRFKHAEFKGKEVHARTLATFQSRLEKRFGATPKARALIEKFLHAVKEDLARPGMDPVFVFKTYEDIAFAKKETERHVEKKASVKEKVKSSVFEAQVIGWYPEKQGYRPDQALKDFFQGNDFERSVASIRENLVDGGVIIVNGAKLEKRTDGLYIWGTKLDKTSWEKIKEFRAKGGIIPVEAFDKAIDGRIKDLRIRLQEKFKNKKGGKELIEKWVNRIKGDVAKTGNAEEVIKIFEDVAFPKTVK